MDATQAQQAPASAPATAAPDLGVGTRILDLPDALLASVLEEALKDPSTFKRLLLVCCSWAACAPGLRSHVCVRADAKIPGDLLAEEMAQLSRVVSLRLHRGSARSLLPTIHTPREEGEGASSTPEAAEDSGRSPAPWTRSLESLTIDCVDLVPPADLSVAFPSLTQLSQDFKDDTDALPDWLDNNFPPNLSSLTLCNWKEYGRSAEGPVLEYRGFPPSLVSLCMEGVGSRFFTSSLGELAQLRSLTLYRCHISALPESIGKLRQLKNLTIGYCEDLRVLPASISDLVSLTCLELPGNVFERIPDLGPHLHKSLLALQHSESTDMFAGLMFLADQFLDEHETLPQDLARCSNIRTLHVQSQHMDSVPDLRGLTSLEDLVLELPEVQELPDVFSAAPSLRTVIVAFKRLRAIPRSLTASASSSLQVLHIICQEPLLLPPITCPPNLKELQLVGKSVRSRRTDRGEDNSAQHTPLHVTLNSSIKKVYLSTRFCVRVEGEGTSLQELARFCERSCHNSEGPHGDVWEGVVLPLPSLSKLTLWCGDQDQQWYDAWISRLAALPSLRVLRIKPCTVGRSGPLRRLEARVSCSPQGQLSWDSLRLEGFDGSIQPPLPSLLTCLSATGGFSRSSDRPSAEESLTTLTTLKRLVLKDLQLKEVPDFLEELSSLEHLKVTNCNMKAIPGQVAFLPRLLELELQDCQKLEVIHGADDGYATLQRIRIQGCPLLEAQPPAIVHRLNLARASISTFED